MNNEQIAHGKRVEERQRVNGQPNGYRPVTDEQMREAKEKASQLLFGGAQFYMVASHLGVTCIHPLTGTYTTFDTEVEKALAA